MLTYAYEQPVLFTPSGPFSQGHGFYLLPPAKKNKHLFTFLPIHIYETFVLGFAVKFQEVYIHCTEPGLY